MGREVKRVPLDFDWPLDKVWSGFLMPETLVLPSCRDCGGRGYSPRALHLFDLWYGRVPFSPADNGSTPLTPDTPAVRAFAERNVERAPEYYGTGELAISQEAHRLATVWNERWCYHLNQEDVDALLAGDRLWDFTRVIVPGKGWQKLDSAPHPTAEQVNEWNIRGFGHDSINASVVVRARCEREGVDPICASCKGEGNYEAHDGQRAEQDAWEETEPPTGEGWQLWETVSEGSPISPVFASAEDLAQWLATKEGARSISRTADPMPYSAALAFVQAGWSPSFVGIGPELQPGAVVVGTQAVLKELDPDTAEEGSGDE